MGCTITTAFLRQRTSQGIMGIRRWRTCKCCQTVRRRSLWNSWWSMYLKEYHKREREREKKVRDFHPTPQTKKATTKERKVYFNILFFSFLSKRSKLVVQSILITFKHKCGVSTSCLIPLSLFCSVLFCQA